MLACPLFGDGHVDHHRKEERQNESRQKYCGSIAFTMQGGGKMARQINRPRKVTSLFSGRCEFTAVRRRKKGDTGRGVAVA